MLRISGSAFWIPLLFASIRVNSTLVRRGFHSSTIVGDYIFIDGGEFSQIVDGNYFHDVETHTLSIPIDVSWSPADLEISITNKTNGAPVLNGANLWANPNENGFYSYGGEISQLPDSSLVGLTVPPRALWNFTSDGQGGGVWTDQTNTTGEIFGGLLRTSDGASDVLGSTAYSLGGIASQRTDVTEASAGDVQTEIPGMISFDMNTGMWKNESASYAGTGKTANSTMVYIPRFGSSGLLLVLGGTSVGIDSSVSRGASAPYISLGNISIYDPISNSWYSQTATGAIPENRESFCAVGVGAADNLSYEIFIYGGIEASSDQNTTSATLNDQLDEVFVLSLPKFEWVKANYTAKQNRYSHTCHLGGNRQMITIGGLGGASTDVDGFNVTDSFPQSLGIFDLTQMEWTVSFSHDAPPYERSDPVQALYIENNPFPLSWSSPALQALFTNSTNRLPPPLQLPSAPINPSPKPTSSSDGLRIGEILAFIVIGITAVLCGLFLTILWKRRKQNKRQEGSMLHSAQISRPVAVLNLTAHSPYYLPELSPVKMRPSYESWYQSEGERWSKAELNDGLPRAI